MPKMGDSGAILDRMIREWILPPNTERAVIFLERGQTVRIEAEYTYVREGGAIVAAFAEEEADAPKGGNGRLHKVRSFWIGGLAREGDGAVSISLPVGAKILSAVNRDGICLFALVVEHMPHEQRRFLVVSDGEEVPADATFIGTVIEYDVPCHVFEL